MFFRNRRFMPFLASDEGGGGTPAPVTIDYDKIAKIVEGKQSVTEDSVLKGYFKQQGLSQEEMTEAIAAYKADKAAKTPDINALNDQITQANNRALQAEIQLQAMTLSTEIGVPVSKMQYLLKMADTSAAVNEGKVDSAKLKEALEAVLKDVPELKGATDNGNGSGFKIGADNNGDKGKTDDAELAKLFGVKM